MKAWIERALNVYPGDLGRGALLCACLFLVITSNVIGKVAGAALFLSRFPAKQLAFVDIASAIAVALVIASYTAIAKHTSVAKLIAGTMCFFASNCLVFWAFAGKYEHAVWVYPVFYAWARIMGVLAPAQIWTLANCLLSTREAKRIFGIVGSGAIVGWIFAGYISKVFVKAFGTESLLLVMAAVLALCGGLVIVTWRKGQKQLNDDRATAIDSDPATQSASSLFLIWNSPYLKAIAGVICISSFLATLTGWQFMAITQQYFHTKDALAVYFGGFNFYTGIVSLVFQLLLTTRFVRRFGIGTSLVLLPAVILLGSGGLLVFGTLLAAVALRGCDQILRYSIDRSSTELLYLPIPTRIKLRVKWFVDTVVWRAGDCAAGIAVLIFASWLALPARQLSWIAILFVGAWLYAISRARHEYVLTLKQNISQHKLEAERIESLVLDRSTTDLLASNIGASDPQEILYALDLLQVDKQVVHPAVRSLLHHPAPEIRSKAVAILSSAGDHGSRTEVEKLLHDPDLNVRTNALLYLSHNAHVDPLELIGDIGQYEDFAVSSAVIAFLGRPGAAQQLDVAQTILSRMLVHAPGHERTRAEIARLLGDLPDSFDPLLAELVGDSDASVAIQAIRSIAKLGKASLVPELVKRLPQISLAHEPAKALASLGKVAVPYLRQCLDDDRVHIEIRREIPSVLATISTPEAERVLIDNLLQADSLLRFNVIRSLNKLHTVDPVNLGDVPVIESLLAAEIVGHYRSYQILHALGGPDASETTPALLESMKQELERIFRLLALLHPSLELHAAYMSLQSDNVTVSDNALEFLENVLRSQLRETLLPLLDRRLSIEQKARIANRFVRTEIGSREQAVAALVSSDDPWLRSCGAYAIGTLGITVLESELTTCLSDPDPLLREVARVAKERLKKKAAGVD